MTRNRSRKHVIDVLFVLALFGVFVATALIVALLGADVYSGTVENMKRNFATQTSLCYVSTKIRQNDAKSAIFLDKAGDTDALVLEQSVGGEIYQTWIYHYDGTLRETFIKKGGEVDPEFGASLMESRDFAVRVLQEGLFQLTTVDKDGVAVDLIVGTRS